MNNGPYQGFRSGEQADGRERLLELLAIFMLFAVPNLVYFVAGYEFSVYDYGVLDLTAEMLSRVGWCLLVPLLLTRRDTFDWKLPRTGSEWRKELGWGLLLVLAIIVCNAVIGVIVSSLGIEDPTQISEPMPTRVAAAFLFFTPIIGLHEELLFRVYAQTRLTQVLGNKRALVVFIASGLFAAMHGYPLVGTLMILVFGLILGTSFQLNGKIPRLVIAHTLWNVGVTVLELLGV